MAANKQKEGERVFKEQEKINAELFTLTYGAIVSQLIKDYEDIEEVNTQLEKMGYNIGLRLIDEFLARSNVGRCHEFPETAETIAKVGFKMFLGVVGSVLPNSWNAERTEFSLILEENPLVDFCELPDNYSSLNYCNIICGVIRGALEMVQMRVECRITKSVLRGDDVTEFKITLKERLTDDIPMGDD
eukprot:TRINITY_DN3547_c0_g1_i1.p1 TRINITY_DN3547_c0_g1~~TRINITY_DN3547_c0_g1_i1.p1  ORF type:complete len:201 (-),score=37.87 TRINITY_DN3547_c0_g1_i1:95-658(-)